MKKSILKSILFSISVIFNFTLFSQSNVIVNNPAIVQQMWGT